MYGQTNSTTATATCRICLVTLTKESVSFKPKSDEVKIRKAEEAGKMPTALRKKPNASRSL